MVSIRGILVIAGLCLLAGNASAQRGEMVCWNDDNGVRHCGDRYPPGHERFDREVFNRQGVLIREEEGEITPEEQAEIDRQLAEEAERVRLRDEARQRDQALLDTYLFVADIEELRDRRLEVMDSQVRVTGISLKNLESKLDDLMRRAQRFAPYSDREDAAPIPENLARDIAQTESSIALREQLIEEVSANQEKLRADFGRDIERFRQLKGY
jgi:hypothetical protein